LAALVRARQQLVITAAQLAAIKVPILAVIGTSDPNYAPVQQLKQHKPEVRMVVVEGATHGSPGDTRGILRQSQTLDALREFLRAHRPSSTVDK
jgi:pimeloyl-ACP methyl ester carboxylesterase